VAGGARGRGGVTGLTYFVHNFAELVVVRALASGLANSELAISITLVNEQMPAARRGFLYSIVQGGWPIGVLIAAGVFLGLNGGLGLDWHVVFLFGVIPLVMVIIGRRWVRPSERFQHVKQIKQAKAEGDDQRVAELLKQYEVDVDEVEQVTVRQLFAPAGVGTPPARPDLDRVADVRERVRGHHRRLADEVPLVLE